LCLFSNNIDTSCIGVILVLLAAIIGSVKLEDPKYSERIGPLTRIPGWL